MNKIIMTIFAIFVLFGCGEDEKNQPIPLPYPPDNNTGGDNSTDGDNNNDNNTSPEIDNKPIANFDFTVNGNIVTFTDKSTDDYGITKWEWNFGTSLVNGAIISNEQNPIHEFKGPFSDDISDGIYPVTLTVYDRLLQNDTIEQKISVTGLRADFYTDINGKYVAFKDRSKNKGSDCFLIECKQAVKWEWNFGDNNTSNEQNPTHTYQKSGTYDVMLKVYTEDNISHYIVQQIIIE